MQSIRTTSLLARRKSKGPRAEKPRLVTSILWREELIEVALRTVEINENNQLRKAKAIYSELAIARELAPITFTVADSKAGRGMGKALYQEKGKPLGMP